jgi:hypothetical protein
MEDAVDNDLARSRLVEDRLREPPKERSTQGAIDEREGPRMPLDRRETRIDSG